MEAIKIIMIGYLGQTMEEEYESMADAIMYFFEESDQNTAKNAVLQARQISEMSEPLRFIRENEIEWNFDETDEEVRNIMKIIAAAGPN
ncbi:hypothetical protein [Stappia sp.]|uniref:hypothetical protein n=1 Tax=Stappia sp. TaxID=1870903 RepID=UPI003C7A47D9